MRAALTAVLLAFVGAVVISLTFALMAPAGGTPSVGPTGGVPQGTIAPPEEFESPSPVPRPTGTFPGESPTTIVPTAVSCTVCIEEGY